MVIISTGETCYCDFSHQMQEKHNKTEVRCPGHYDEGCGNQNGVSVYKSGVKVKITPGDGDACVYAEITTLPYGNIAYYSSSCNHLRSAACQNGTVNAFYRSTDSHDRCIGGICVLHTLKTWGDAGRMCNLVKVTSVNEGDLKGAMVHSFLSKDKYTYWIGLRRVYVKKWLNGSDVLCSATGQPVNQGCLATTGTSLFRWEDCSSKLPTICESVHPESTTSASTTSSGPHTSLKSIDTGTSTPTTMSALTSQTAFTRAAVKQPEEPLSSENDQSYINIGLYCGLSVLGVVIGAIVLTLLLVMYKQKKGCFSSTSHARRSNSLRLVAMDNDLYLSTMHVQNGQGPSTANRNCDDDEYDLLGQNKHGCSNGDELCRKTGEGNTVSSDPGGAAHYNRLGHSDPASHHDERGAYDHVLKNQTIRDETYDHAGDNGAVRRGDDVYDHAGDNGAVRRGDDVCDHAGDKGAVCRGDDVYDHTGDKGALRRGDDVYDHAGDKGAVRRGDDVYDHAEDKGAVCRGDDVYDHAGDKGAVCRGDEVYDHAGDKGAVRRGDDVYDHAGDKGAVRRGDDVYDHAGDKGAVRRGDDVYDHAGESPQPQEDEGDLADSRHDTDTQVGDSVGGTENGNAMIAKAPSNMPGITDTSAEIYCNLGSDQLVYNNDLDRGQAAETCTDEDGCYYNIG
ncbi:uncharacterized protein LOC124125488 isoform X2 [Haliotis rufescens]|uniref:uncharacterized protein LOC124125488 isoform X2 n=1 Tax=Haliotis rufescens TaxID=6454 RepID=UPI00201F3E13|nr:uncharacterized protein LOC124125488 isoform X2 [Haliotis rufescens]